MTARSSGLGLSKDVSPPFAAWSLALLVGCTAAGPVAPLEPVGGEVADAAVEPARDASVGVQLDDAGLPLEVPWGAPFDVGPRLLDDGGLEVRVFSANATRVQLEVFADATGAATQRVSMLSDDAGVWRATITGPSAFYGLRAWGPNWPWDEAWTPGSLAGFVSDVDDEGNRFNPNKLLIDPYAREVTHDFTTPEQPSGRPYGERAVDTAPLAPRSVAFFVAPHRSQPPTRPLKDDVIYEVHLRGLTQNDPSIPQALRGTYAGAALKARALAALGVTAVEFLPLAETQNERNDVDPESVDGDNYWGYSTFAYFAPDRRYAADRSPGGATREFQRMVEAFHAVGLKVFVDVVYNHTGEWAVQSFRGLDNQTWYSLGNNRRDYQNHNGVSPDLNTANPRVQDFINDSLRYWHEALGVDGFRFDLASLLGNTCEHGCFRFDRVDRATALNHVARALRPRAAAGGPGVDLIAEPWGVGAGTYQLGNFPSGWSEWNGAFRDDVRSAQNQLGFGSPTTGWFAARVAGSRELFADDGRRPFNSINYLSSHDGLTLNDLYACNGKNNTQAWPYGPSSGGDDSNRSWDQGGSRPDQRKAARTGFALVMLSAGTPMIGGGDEFLRSVRCNNNAYNVDSVGTWLDWSWTDEQRAFQAFAGKMIAFRRAHVALRPDRYLDGRDDDGDGLPQLAFFSPDGRVASGAYLDDPTRHAVGWRLDGSELGDEAAALFVAWNGWSASTTFTLPSAGEGAAWYRAVDTCPVFEGEPVFTQQLRFGAGAQYGVCARGVTVFVAR